MSPARARRTGIALLLVLAAGVPILVFLPGGVGAVRWAGVSLTWWYAGLGAPVAALLVASVFLLLSRE